MEFESIGDWCKWLEKNFSPVVFNDAEPILSISEPNQ